MDILKNKTAILGIYFLIILFFACAVSNLLLVLFPVSYELGHDEAEHLHVAFLLEQGQRPYLDFIENHPTLFNNYLKFIWKVFNLKTVRAWALLARFTILIHIILMIAIFYKWILRILKLDNSKLLWVLFMLSFSFIGFYNPQLDFMWQIRPDWISYAYSFFGLYLFYLFIDGLNSNKKREYNYYPLLLFSAILVGLGNAILPKGFTIILGIFFGLIAAIILKLVDLKIFLNKKFLFSLISFGLLSFLFFISFALLDCHLSKIDFLSWLKANFFLNLSKHLPLTNADNNPIYNVSCIFSLNFVLIVFLALWIIYKITKEYKEKNDTNYQILLIISFFVIVVNIVMTGFGNGLSWPHYFIPCVFAATTIYIILLNDVYESLINPNLKEAGSLYKYFVIFVMAILFSLAIRQPIELQAAIINRQANLSDSRISGYKDYLNDSIMPTNLVYFSPKPTEMPIRAKHSGYYFMLVIDKKIWQDCHRLGLGPVPENHFKLIFDNHLPDILAFNGPIKLSEFIVNATNVQKIDLTWLSDIAEKNYVLMQHKLSQLYVRKDLVNYLASIGWQEVKK